MATNTADQFDSIIEQCKEVFLKKISDYGASWRILRPSSLTDQVMIKAKRIKHIEEQGTQQVADGIDEEFTGMINYSVITLIQIELGTSEEEELSQDKAAELYDHYIRDIREIMMAKNHDYGEAWRDMRVSSFTDLIMMKLLRIKRIEDNQGRTLVSEGIDSHFRDIVNYSIFALIKLQENEDSRYD